MSVPSCCNTDGMPFTLSYLCLFSLFQLAGGHRVKRDQGHYAMRTATVSAGTRSLAQYGVTASANKPSSFHERHELKSDVEGFCQHLEVLR